MVRLESVSAAVSYLAALRTDPATDLDFVFSGDLENIRIVIDGPEFHHSITGELSRGLSAYQDEIYKAAKFALYGREGRFQLTQEQRKAFELVLEVREGSTDLFAPIQAIADALAGGITNLDPTMLAIVIVSVVLILTTAYVATKIYDGIQETKQKKDASDAQSRQMEAVTALASNAVAQQTSLVAALGGSSEGKSVANRFELAQSNGLKEVIKSVPSATEVQVQGVSFDADDIKELRRRSPRAKSEYAEVLGSFRVFADTNIHPVRLTLSGSELPGEFNVDFPEDITSDQIELLWKAIREKITIDLEVGVTIIREKVKSGVILEVILPNVDGVASA